MWSAATERTAPYAGPRASGFEGSAYPQTFVLADLDADGIEPGAAHVFLSGSGMLFFFPLGKPASWRLLAMRPPTDHTPHEAPVTLNEVQALADTYTDASVGLHDPVWMTNFRLHNRGATHYRAGPVFLAGDAAHIHSPAGAQGMNTGIQVATNLGWKLAQALRGHGDPALLDTYEPERAPVRLQGAAFHRPGLRHRHVHQPDRPPRPHPDRAGGNPRGAQGETGRAYFFRTVSQLAIHYRRSALSLDGPNPPRHGPRAGDRLPDAAIVHDGRPTTLHTAVAAPGWHLLLCGPTGNWRADDLTTLITRSGELLAVHRLTTQTTPGALRDVYGQASRRLGLSPADVAQYLVRPDGHVGYRAGGTDLARLARYLGRWLTPRSSG